MRLMEIENHLKTLIEKDKSSPEVYEWIFELVYKYFLRYKIMPDYEKAREVSTLMAEELYFKLQEGYPFISWIGYISKSYKAYLDIWIKENNSIIQTRTEEQELAVVSMYAASTLYDDSISQIYSADCLRNLPRLIDQILDSSIFYPDTSEYLNARTSLLLSVLRKKFVSFRQTEEDANYTRILYRIFLDKLALQLHPEFFEDITKSLHFYREEESNPGYELFTV